MVRFLRAEALPKPPRPRAAAAGSHESPPPPDQDAAAAHPEASRPAEARRQGSLAGVKVLAVDDDEGNLDYFVVALRTYGALVTTASSAVEALRLVREQKPDVVLSDIAMIGHDGYWLVREIRRLADPSVRHVPVVATTAYGREHSRERTLAAGFTEHLAKPVDPDVLRRTVASLAGR